jgi:hypothetical protein
VPFQETPGFNAWVGDQSSSDPRLSGDEPRRGFRCPPRTVTPRL